MHRKRPPRWGRGSPPDDEPPHCISAGGNASRGGDEDSIFKNVIRLGRNFGIGLVMADQTPQKQDSFARSNIGLKCFLRQDDEEGIMKFRKLMGGLSDEQMHKPTFRGPVAGEKTLTFQVELELPSHERVDDNLAPPYA